MATTLQQLRVNKTKVRERLSIKQRQPTGYDTVEDKNKIPLRYHST